MSVVNRNSTENLSTGESHIMEYEIVGVTAFKGLSSTTPVGNVTTNKEKKEISRMVVEISFRRKIQYHVANTFLQVC